MPKSVQHIADPLGAIFEISSRIPRRKARGEIRGSGRPQITVMTDDDNTVLPVCRPSLEDFQYCRLDRYLSKAFRIVIRKSLLPRNISSKEILVEVCGWILPLIWSFVTVCSRIIFVGCKLKSSAECNTNPWMCSSGRQRKGAKAAKIYYRAYVGYR